MLAVFLMLAAIKTHAQTELILAKSTNTELWGYIDLDGNWVIQPVYKKAFDFSESGYAVVVFPSSGEYGFIDTDNHPLNTVAKDYKLKSMLGFGVQGFSDGLVAVRVGKPWGFLGTDGEFVYQPTYTSIMSFNDGYATADIDGKFFILDAYGNSTEITNPEITDLKSCSEGLIPYKNSEGLHGFVNTDAEIVIPARYNSVGYFSDGLAWARNNADQIGFINKVGDVVIDFQFQKVKDFSSGMARVMKNDTWGYVNKEGDFATFAIDKNYDYSEGLCMAGKNDMYGFIDKEGNWAIEPRFTGLRDFKNGYAAAKDDNELWGLIDKSGDWVLEPKYIAIKDVVMVK